MVISDESITSALPLKSFVRKSQNYITASTMDTKGGKMDTGASGDEVEEAKSATSTSDSQSVASTSGSGSGHSNEVYHKDVDATSVASATGSAASHVTVAGSELIDFKIVFNKKRFDISLPLYATVRHLKDKTQTLTGIPPEMQKVMFRGLARDHQTLMELKVTTGSKLMVVGSTMQDVLSVAKPPEGDLTDNKHKAPLVVKMPWSLQKIHKNVLDMYGKPADAIPGIKDVQMALPQMSLTGIINKMGMRVRLTFKLEIDQLWIATKEKLNKFPMHSVKDVISEPIIGQEEYLITAIQLGPTESSQYFVYWVPAQYRDSMRDIILGKWMAF